MNQLPMSKIGKHIISVTFGISVIEIWLLFDYLPAGRQVGACPAPY